MGLLVIQEGPHGIPEKMMAAIGYMKQISFEKPQASRLTQAFIVDANGIVLVHPKPDYMINRVNLSNSTIVAELNEQSQFKRNGILVSK